MYRVNNMLSLMTYELTMVYDKCNHDVLINMTMTYR